MVRFRFRLKPGRCAVECPDKVISLATHGTGEGRFMQNFEAADVARLEKAYSTPQIVDQRRRFRAAVAARPGEVGLDVGCGAGHLSCELAREVAPSGRVVAIDKSLESVNASKARVAREKLTVLGPLCLYGHKVAVQLRMSCPEEIAAGLPLSKRISIKR